MTSDPEAPKEAFVWIWLPERTTPVVAGRIAKDGGIYTFTYGRSYLERKDAIPLYLPELPLERGEIRPLGQLRIANCLRDSAPDSWGERVIINRLTGRKGKAGDPVDFDDLTFMLESGSDRAGALDFQTSATAYAPSQTQNASLEELLEAADRVERGLPLTPDLDLALHHGSSIGGARPKATIESADRKFIAKFSATNDTYNVVKGEFIAMRLAEHAGLRVAPVSLERASGKDVLLIERFDRKRVADGWRRRAMVSALTLEELPALSGHHAGYDSLGDIIRARFIEPAATLRDLFARMTFNVLVGNTDDHARNHAAFWNGERLALTPAYDICPQARNGREANQAIGLNKGDRRSQVAVCLAAAAAFQLRAVEAAAIVARQIVSIRRHWPDVCDEAALSVVDRAYFWRRQFLNPYALEGAEEALGESVAGLD